MYLNLSREEKLSVHLADWPEVMRDQIDPKIENDVKLAMQLSSLGRASRSKAKIKVRQPLAKAYAIVRSKDDIESLPRIEDQDARSVFPARQFQFLTYRVHALTMGTFLSSV